MTKSIKSTRWKLVDSMFMSAFLTAAVIEFSQVGAAFIDGLIISRFLGPDAIAGQGIANPIFSIVGVISGLIATGMQITCTRLLGRGNVKDLNRYFSQSLFIGIVFSVIGTALVLIFPKPFAALLGAKGNAASLLEPASQYLLGVGAGIPALMLIAILSPAIQLDSGRKLIQNGAIICSVADFILDMAAVYLKLGMLGIGLATAAAQTINLAYLCLHFRRKDRMIRFVKPDIPAKDFLIMLSNGTEKATRRLVNVFRPVILNSIIISYGGAVAMSALSIRNSFSGFTEIAGAGIASAVAMLAGLYYGEINEEAISEIKTYGWKNTAIFSSIICVVLFVFAKPIARLYTDDNGELLNMVVFAIRMLGLQTAFQTIVKSRISYLQSISKIINMNLLVLASQLVFILLSAFTLGKLFGVYGILSSFLASDALSVLTIYIYYQIKCKMVMPRKKELLNLPPEFDLHPGNVISLDIRNMDDVTFTAEQIQMFCKGHKFDSKIGYYASLSFEEIAANIIQYGFPQNKKKDPIIDLRIVALNDSLVMRIRDDCPHFDITKRIAEINEDDSDPVSNLGIRITSKIAKDIKYTHAFETNNIIITYSSCMK